MNKHNTSSLFTHFGFDAATIARIDLVTTRLGVSFDDAIDWLTCKPSTATERAMRERLGDQYDVLDQEHLIWCNFLAQEGAAQ